MTTSQLSLLDSIIDSTIAIGAAPTIISEQNDGSKINWRNGLSDPAEMAKIAAASGTDAMINAALRRANLATKDGKVCFFSALVPAWHEIGKIISEATDSANAIQLAELDWDVNKIEQYIDFQDRRVQTGSFAIVRSDTGAILTYGKSVGGRYQTVNNKALFAFLDDVMGAGLARYETAGAIGNGERVFMLCKLPRTSTIARGDDVEYYVALVASHDGTLAIRVFPTANRIVCANTCDAALRQDGKRGVSLRHTTNVKQRVNDARRAIGLADQAAERFEQTAQTLAQTKMPNPLPYFKTTLDEIVDVSVADVAITQKTIDDRSALNAALAITNHDERAKAEEKYTKTLAKRGELLDAILSTYDNERNNGLASIAGSAWAAANAVTETLQHGSILRYKGSERERQENRFDSILDGRIADLSSNAVQNALTMAN